MFFVGWLQAAGIEHYEMYYLDGSNPPEHVLQRFLAVTEGTPGAWAPLLTMAVLLLPLACPALAAVVHPPSHACLLPALPSLQAPSRCTARQAWAAPALASAPT